MGVYYSLVVTRTRPLGCNAVSARKSVRYAVSLLQHGCAKMNKGFWRFFAYILRGGTWFVPSQRHCIDVAFTEQASLFIEASLVCKSTVIDIDRFT